MCARRRPAPISPGEPRKAEPASPVAPAKAPGVFYFRKEIVLATVPQHYWVHVSADNRFVLHVNGQYAAEGPARGDLLHWRFETVDLAPLLRAGNNVIAAVVWNFGEAAPTAQMSNRTGFLMQGDTEAEAAVNTGRNGAYARRRAVRFWATTEHPHTTPRVRRKSRRARWTGAGINRATEIPAGRFRS